VVFEYKLLSFDGMGRVLPIYLRVVTILLPSSRKEERHFRYLWSYVLFNYGFGCLVEKVDACWASFFAGLPCFFLGCETAV
jgi:hypothetical protein